MSTLRSDVLNITTDHTAVLPTSINERKQLVLSLLNPAFSLDTSSDHTVADLLPSPYSHDPLSIILTQERLKQLEPKVQSLSGAVRVRYETALAEVQA